MRKLSFSVIGLGANLDRADSNIGRTLQTALAILHAEPNISISAVSRLWRTPAYPPGSGPDFANAVAIATTPLDAQTLLFRLHAIEADFGRDRSAGRWSARVLDLDLIAMNDTVVPDVQTQKHWMELAAERQRIETPDRLILPHPRLQDRGFVLGPLAEIAPEWRHPVTGLTVSRMLAALRPEGLKGMTVPQGRITGSFP